MLQEYSLVITFPYLCRPILPLNTIPPICTYTLSFFPFFLVLYPYLLLFPACPFLLALPTTVFLYPLPSPLPSTVSFDFPLFIDLLNSFTVRDFLLYAFSSLPISPFLFLYNFFLFPSHPLTLSSHSLVVTSPSLTPYPHLVYPGLTFETAPIASFLPYVQPVSKDSSPPSLIFPLPLFPYPPIL